MDQEDLKKLIGWGAVAIICIWMLWGFIRSYSTGNAPTTTPAQRLLR